MTYAGVRAVLPDNHLVGTFLPERHRSYETLSKRASCQVPCYV